MIQVIKMVSEKMIVVMRKRLHESVRKANDCCCFVMKKGSLLCYLKILVVIIKDNPRCCVENDCDGYEKNE